MLVLKHILPLENREFPLRKKFILIGTSHDNDIVIESKHPHDFVVQIESSDGKQESYNLKSSQGGVVRINGKNVKSAILHVGDRIEIAKELFLLDRPSIGAPEDCDSEIFLTQLSHFAETVGNERDLRKLAKAIIHNCLALIEGTDTFIITLDDKGNPALFASFGNDKSQSRFSDTIVQQVLKSRKPVLVSNALMDNSFNKSQSIIDLKLHSVICVPIIIAEKITGVLYIGSNKPSTSYCEYDLKIMKTYAALVGMLIDHVEFISHQRNTINQLSKISADSDIVAESKVMKSILSQAKNCAGTDIAVLIEGETGTGKDLIAQFIHSNSRRHSHPFVVVNCSSLKKDLLESELFGHKKGGFTGAVSDHRGLFSMADRGTLFLDEIGEIGIGIQAKLLRTLETGKIRAVGSSVEDEVNVRIVCATNRNLEKMVNENIFREDLY
ncbi:MAG: GAF domain-containing protein, partial [Chitinivibrionales bacterium]|nr:GAF domain-containing protein [Chitinivibrionales bacterium]